MEFLEDARGFLTSEAGDPFAIALQLVFIFVVTLVVLRIAQHGVERVVRALFDREAIEGTAQELSAVELQKRRDTLVGLAGGVVRLVIIVVALLTALGTLRIDVGPAIAGLGILGLSLGLGVQHLVRDYVAGAFILVENQYAKGDVVKIADVTGTVEDFNLRRTTIRDIDGTLHTVPNGLIGVAGNLTRIWARINVDLTIPHGTEIERAREVVDRVGREMAEDPRWARRVLEAPRVDRVEALSAQGVTLKVLGTVRAADRWSAAGELRRRIATALASNGLTLAGP